MSLETLYSNYGKAAVALEIAQGKFNEAKKELAEALSKGAEVEGNKDQETKQPKN
jgi:hypothetical protein